MLKGIHPALTPDLLWTLAAMGHGDVLAIVDANYPAHSLHERVILLPGVDIHGAILAIGSLFPVDQAIEPAVFAMTPEGEPSARIEAHAIAGGALDTTERRHVQISPLERLAFYERAKAAFAVVLTGETRSYACFLVAKGVVAAPQPNSGQPISVGATDVE